MKKILLTALITAYSFLGASADNYYDFVADRVYYKLEQFSPIDDRIIANVCSEYEYGSNDYKPSYFGSVVIPEQIEYDGKVYDVIGVSHNAFRDCTDLNEVILPSSILWIEMFAFRNCGNLKLRTPSSVSYINCGAFYDTFLMDCDLSKLTYLDNWTFAGLKNKSITLGESVEFFGSYMFEDSNVEEVIFIESDATETKHVLFPTCAFSKSKLKEIRLPKRDLKLSIGFINNCPDLERVIFPDVDYIEPTWVQTVIPDLEGCLIEDSENLISESPNIKEIVSLNSTPILFRKGLIYLDESVLDDYSKCVLKVPAGSEDAYRADPTWGKFKHIEGFQPGEYAGVESAKRDDDENAGTRVRKLFAGGQGIHLELPEPCVAEIYNLAGTLVCRAEHPGGTFRAAVPQGIYLLRTTKH